MICFLLVTLWISVSSGNAYAYGKGCGIYLKFDKYIFVTEKVIPIGVEDLCQIYTGKTIAVTVSSADTEIDPATGWPTATSENTYLDRKVIVKDRITQVDFEVPQSTQEYRFLVTLRDDRNEITDQVIVFTKDGADVITVSDIMVPATVMAGSEFKITARITDGLENPVASVVSATAALQRPVCDPQSWLSSIVDINLVRTAGSAGDESIIYQGLVALPPDFPSGMYDVVITTYSSPYEGYLYPNPSSYQTRVENGGVPVTTLFYNIRELNGSIFSKANNDVRYILGDDIIVEGQALTDDCLPLSGVRIVGDFYGYPTPLIRSSAITDEQGNFTVHFQTYPLLQTNTQYLITLKAEYSNNTYTWNDDYVFLDDVKKFPFEANGITSRAEVMANQEGKVVSLTLDKDLKKMTVTVESQRNDQAQYSVAIPSELLSGDVIIQKDGGEPLTLIGSQYFADQHGPEMDPANGDIRHSYSLSAYKGDGFMMVGYVNLAGGRTTIDITGTSVIPEFGTISLLVTAVAISAALAAAKHFARTTRL